MVYIFEVLPIAKFETGNVDEWRYSRYPNIKTAYFPSHVVSIEAKQHNL